MTIKEQYWQYSLIIIILFMGVILFHYFSPLFSGILGASTVYILVRKQMFYLTGKKRLGRNLAASLILIEVVMCFLIPLAIAVWLLIQELQGINLNLTSSIESVQEVIAMVKERTGYNILSTDNLVSAAAYLPKIGQILIGSVSSFAVNSVVMLFVLYFMLIGGTRMEAYLNDLLPFNNENKKDVLREIDVMVKSNAIGIPLLASIQGIFATLGYIIFGVPDPILFGFLTCFATIIPIVGTMFIWLPLVIYMAITGDWLNALGLTAYSLIVISNVDNLLRFVLQKKIANTHPLITVFGVVIGLPVFGFWGVIFGPLFLSMFILLVDIFKRGYLDSGK
ncbi:MAG: AI-2E family transporter [Dysgonomonas sp.]|jgi:predicted PurR-regulated permease PerM|uniref:AI-2E family transporter n=1 Tax=unclassified Dysgonomonas TaxID=2630389 RepID=UPI0025C654F9|nr:MULTISPECIES: AI-2E family transporter [unclassified Dysgonomonas]MDR1715023.1 AI-2E family transporter [Prevotella sp.]MDR2001536.1 AI-2E family transporter [Prevotella sp.]HMM03109.1 AI-2E family transporter [Dysgonomonas sp.]